MRNSVARIWFSAFVLAGVVAGTVACDKPKDPQPTTAPNNNATPSNPTVSQPETRSAEMNQNPQPTSSAKLPETKDPMEHADVDMKKVLVEFDALLGGKSIAQLTPQEARKLPTMTDAVKKVLEKDGKSTAPIEMAKVENRKIPGGNGQIDARIYTPKVEKDVKTPLPVIAYWHGGGFVLADLDVYDATPRVLAKGANAIVVSMDYRHAPEQKFPAAHEDAFAGYKWVVNNAGSFGGDPKRIAVAGESAGGNLAANVAIMARDKSIAMPVHQLLVYPVAQSSVGTDSYKEWDMAKPLNKSNMLWFFKQYTKTPADSDDVRLNLVNAKLEGLPKTTIILAEIDPLRSDGDLLAQKMKDAKVDVDRKIYAGVTHEFFGMGAAVKDAKEAEDYAAERLKDAFKK